MAGQEEIEKEEEKNGKNREQNEFYMLTAFEWQKKTEVTFESCMIKMNKKGKKKYKRPILHVNCF